MLSCFHWTRCSNLHNTPWSTVLKSQTHNTRTMHRRRSHEVQPLDFARPPRFVFRTHKKNKFWTSDPPVSKTDRHAHETMHNPQYKFIKCIILLKRQKPVKKEKHRKMFVGLTTAPRAYDPPLRPGRNDNEIKKNPPKGSISGCVLCPHWFNLVAVWTQPCHSLPDLTAPFLCTEKLKI